MSDNRLLDLFDLAVDVAAEQVAAVSADDLHAKHRAPAGICAPFWTT